METSAPNTDPIIVERTYNAPVEKVWEAITNRDKMEQWYFNIPEFKPEVGFEFQFSGGSDEKTYLHKCRVLEVEPLRKLSHSWTYDGYEGYSVVTWELTAEGDKTHVKLTHTGTHTFPQNLADFARKSFMGGWDYIVNTGLTKFVEA